MEYRLYSGNIRRKQNASQQSEIAGDPERSLRKTATGGWLGVSTVLPTTDPSAFAEPAASKNYERVNIADLMNTTYKSVSQGDSAAVDHDRMIGNASDINFPAAIVPSDPTARSVQS